MKKKSIRTAFALFLCVILLCTGCTAALQNLEDRESRVYAEAMLDALMANDFPKAYSLVSALSNEEAFRQTFAQMRGMLQGGDSYQLQLLSIYRSTTLSDGQKTGSVSSVYEVRTGSSRIILSLQTDSQIGLSGFYLTPYENTDYYFTGTLAKMKGAAGIQWVFLLLNILPLGFTVFALADCCRLPIKRKALWILVLLLGFFTCGMTLSATGFRLNVQFGWITAYSALIRYGSGTVVLRVLLPAGATVYFAMRRSLLSKNEPAGGPAQAVPETAGSEAAPPDPSLSDD